MPLIKILFTSFIAIFISHKLYAQRLGTANKTMIFSAIKGTISKPDTFQFATTATLVKLISGDTASFKIISQKNGKLIVAFAPAAGFVGIAKAAISINNSSNKNSIAVALVGLSTNGLEGENEAPLARIATALGYKVDIGWGGLANNSLPILQGDEIAASQFLKASKGNVEIVPVARYSPDFELPFGYYIDSAAMPQKTQVGILAKAGLYPEHQTLFPAIAKGGYTFNPGSKAFGFYATGPTHTAYSEDVWNMLLHPTNAVHATRIYPLKNTIGDVIKNTYLLCFEEAKNGDYNDYVFVVKNIVPVTDNHFTKLFNGKNLNGWHTYLKGIGNTDPNNNFKIEDSALHVLGKDLGYAITNEPYANYHFKIEFKWGEKRWPPRENDKRDAGICYNIPLNAPDSIWPQSIECQVQEGDVGDFWLLGFSTIKADGKYNQPSAHTRMIKFKDGEKPNGEWNCVEIISYNGKCVHIVNGVVVNVGEDANVKNGRILLQSEYAEVYYRNVMIRKL